MKPYKMQVVNCALFSIMHIVCDIFPWKIIFIVLEIVLSIHYSKPVKVPLMLMPYRKTLHVGVVSRQM